MRRVPIRERLELGIEVDRLIEHRFAAGFGKVIDQRSPVSTERVATRSAVDSVASESIWNRDVFE